MSLFKQSSDKEASAEKFPGGPGGFYVNMKR